MRRTFTLLIALAMLMLGAAPGLASNRWGSNHWAAGSDGIASMTVSDDGFDPVQTKVMMNVWGGGVDNLVPEFVAGKGDIVVKTGRSMTWLGRAQIWVDGSGHITKGQVKMNTTLLDTYPDEATDHVLCQELGHIFGLSHNTTDGCMSDGSDGWDSAPNSHDFDELNLIYGHIDSGSDDGDGGGGGGGFCPLRKPGCSTQSTGRWVTVHTSWVTDYQG